MVHCPDVPEPSEFLQIEVSDRVATVWLNRPPVNALNPPFLREIRDALDGLASNREVSVVVLASALDRVFCAGVDLTAHQSSGPRPIDPGEMVREALWSVLECQVPVIGAINGPALGAGLAFVACCDVIVASERAVFGLPEIDVGVLGGYAHLARLVGRYCARELFLTGQRVPAAEFATMAGAISRVVPHSELLPITRELARTMALKSPVALRLAKEAICRVDDLPLKDAYRVEQDYTNRLRTFDDSAEARTAFREKRAPRFTGR
jgi:enoyl-CoA hydratase